MHSAARSLILAAIVGFVLLLSLVAPATAQLASDTQVDTGVHGYGTYDGGRENVSLVSGNLQVCVPLVSLPGRNKHDLSIPLCYNSQFREVRSDGPVSALSYFPWVWGASTPKLGPGWTLTGRAFGYLTDYQNSSYVIVMPDGAKYGTYAGMPDPPRGTLTSGSDFTGAGIYAAVNGGTAYYIAFKNGTNLRYNSEYEYDTNGNAIQFESDHIVDTVGRRVDVIASDATNNSPASISFRYPDPSGTNSTVTVTIQLQTVRISAQSSSGQWCPVNSTSGIDNYSMPSAVVLPNGLSYTFQYDECGILSKITYPTGGYTRFESRDFDETFPNQNTQSGTAILSVRQITAKYVCSAPAVSLGATTAASGNNCPVGEAKTTYAPTVNTSNPGNAQNVVTDPYGNKTVYYFSSPTVFPWGPQAAEIKREIYEGSSKLQTIRTEYVQGVMNTAVPYPPPLPSRRTTTLEDTGLVSKIEWDYYLQNVGAGPSSLKEKREYDYGQGAPGPLLRRTNFTWLHLDPETTSTYNSNSWHILDRKTSETVYDGSGRKVAQTTYAYDSTGIDTSVSVSGAYDPTYGARGNLTNITRWRDTDGALLTTSNVYDNAGNIVSTTDPKGITTRFSYSDNYVDGVNRNSYAFLTQTTYPSVDGISHITQKQYYWGSGLVAASCGQNFTGSSCGRWLGSPADYAQYSYDSMGRPIATNTGDGGSTSVCYSEVGASCSSRSYPLKAVTSTAIASGVTRVSTAVLDGLGRTSQTQLNTDPYCSSGVKVDKTYDLNERVSTVSNPYCATGEAAYGVTSYTYDGLGRVKRVTHPDASYAENQYSGRAVLSSDEGTVLSSEQNGVTTKIQRVSQTDALGRLVKVCEVSSTVQKGNSYNTPSICGLDIAASGFLTLYGYDALGNMTSVTQGAVSRSFTYNSLSQLVLATNPESGTTCYGNGTGSNCDKLGYDANGNLIAKTDARGITTNYTYDALNRLIGKSYSGSSTDAACFQYDQGSTNGIGRLTNEWTQPGSCSSTPPTNATTKRSLAAYDNMGRVTTDKQCAPPNNCDTTSYTSTYAYDLAGDVTQSTNGLSGPSTLSFWNQYDSAGRLCWVGDQQGTGCYAPGLFTARKYNAAGGLVDANMGPNVSNVFLHREYNNRLRPMSETDTGVGAATAEVAISGAEQHSGTSVGTLTFSGTGYVTQTVYDTGTFLINFQSNFYPVPVSYGQGDTPGTLAQKIMAAMPSCGTLGMGGQPFLLKGALSGGRVSVTRCDGSNTSFSFSASLAGHDTYNFPTASFSVVANGGSGGVGVVEIYGQEQSKVVQTGTVDDGTYGFSLQQNSPPVMVSYGQGDTPSTLASKLVAAMYKCGATGTDGSPIALQGVSNGPVVTLTPCDGSDTAYPFSYFLAGHSGSGNPGLSVTASGSTLISRAIYDNGTVSLTVNGQLLGEASWGKGSTPASIVSSLITAVGGNNLVSVQQSSNDPTSLTITGVGATATSSYSYSVDFTHYVSQLPISFQATPSTGALAGGQQAPLYSWSIPANDAGYTPNGNIRSATDSVIGSWQYGYDDMNRLVEAVTSTQASGAHIDWTYDRYGNRWDQSATGGPGYTIVQPHNTFYGNTNRIDGPLTCDPSNPQPFCYDVAGNLLNDGVHTYAYDAENRISKVDGQSSYVYDAEGRRVAKYGSGGAIVATYILGLGGQQVTELNGSGQWVHSNVYAGGVLIATYTGPAGAGAAGYHYHLTDWLGTMRVQTTANGVLEQTCFSYPFGDGLSCTSPSGAADATEHHFTGKERDATGLDYFGARYYASNMGRFLTPDWAALPTGVPYAVFGDPQSLNLYAYVGNNPTTGIDVDGHYGEYVLGTSGFSGYGGSNQYLGEPNGSMSYFLEQNAPIVAEAEELMDNWLSGGPGPSEELQQRAKLAQDAERWNHDIVLFSSEKGPAPRPPSNPEDGGCWTTTWIPYKISHGQLRGPLGDQSANVSLRESIKGVDGGKFVDRGTRHGKGEDHIASMGALTPPANQHWYVNGERVQLVMGMNATTGKVVLTWEVHIIRDVKGPQYSAVGSGDQ